MSDHMNEAVNYVKDLKNKINELSSRRDELKRSWLRVFLILEAQVITVRLAVL